MTKLMVESIFIGHADRLRFPVWIVTKQSSIIMGNAICIDIGAL
jgi:hypothetical protein